MHGMLHKISHDTLYKKIEPLQSGSSDLAEATAVVGTTEIPCYTHGLNIAKKKPWVAKPKENYIDICVEGAKHFGLPEDFIQQLQALEQMPRRTPEQFKRLEPPVDFESLDEWTIEEVAAKGNVLGEQGDLYPRCILVI